LELEEGSLRCTLVPPSQVGVPDKGANDMPPTGPPDLTKVTIIETYKTKADYEAHRKAPHVLEDAPKVSELINGPESVTVLEFDGTTHFAKP